MVNKLLIFGALLGGTVYATPVQVTITLSGGNFDSGQTTASVDTGTGFTTSAAGCVGAGCLDFGLLIANLNSKTFAFTVPTGSLTGTGSVLSGTITQAANVSGLSFTGQSSFNANSTITENITATSVLGVSGAYTGTMVLNWSGNSSSQPRPATGTLTLNGDVALVPEPSTALMLSLAVAGLFGIRRVRRSRHC